MPLPSHGNEDLGEGLPSPRRAKKRSSVLPRRWVVYQKRSSTAFGCFFPAIPTRASPGKPVLDLQTTLVVTPFRHSPQGNPNSALPLLDTFSLPESLKTFSKTPTQSCYLLRVPNPLSMDLKRLLLGSLPHKILKPVADTPEIWGSSFQTLKPKTLLQVLRRPLPPSPRADNFRNTLGDPQKHAADTLEAVYEDPWKQPARIYRSGLGESREHVVGTPRNRLQFLITGLKKIKMIYLGRKGKKLIFFETLLEAFARIPWTGAVRGKLICCSEYSGWTHRVLGRTGRGVPVANGWSGWIVGQGSWEYPKEVFGCPQRFSGVYELMAGFSGMPSTVFRSCCQRVSASSSSGSLGCPGQLLEGGLPLDGLSNGLPWEYIKGGKILEEILCRCWQAVIVLNGRNVHRSEFE